MAWSTSVVRLTPAKSDGATRWRLGVGVELLLVASSGLGWLALELRAARVSGGFRTKRQPAGTWSRRGSNEASLWSVDSGLVIGQPGRVDRLLLTSAGVRNATIHDALLDLLGRPIEDCTALCIPTAMYGHPHAGPGEAVWEFVAGRSEQPMAELGWKSVGLIELTALPSIDEERWVPLVRKADVLLVSGGDALYLCHWMRESGLTDLLPSLDDTVWIGMSAGSMVMTPRIGKEFVGWRPPAGDDRALGLVDFSIYPHLDHESLPENTLANAKTWAAALDCPAYAIDDETALRVVGDAVDVVSEGQWHRFDA